VARVYLILAILLLLRFAPVQQDDLLTITLAAVTPRPEGERVICLFANHQEFI